MYCPLCQSEFRRGFTQCSDCRVPLVATLELAEGERRRFWKGVREEKLDRILTALAETNVPFHYKGTSKAHTHIALRLIGFPVGKPQPMFELEYEVWIFRRDLERARKAVADVLHRP